MTKEEFLENRKTEYTYGIPSIVNKTKHQYKMLKIGFVIFIIIASVVIGAMFLTLTEQREESLSQDKIIKDLKYDNVNLQNTINSKNQLVRNYQNETKNLKKQIRNIVNLIITPNQEQKTKPILNNERKIIMLKIKHILNQEYKVKHILKKLIIKRYIKSLVII